MTANTSDAAIRRLWRDRPRSRFTIASLLAMGGLIVATFFTTDLKTGLDSRRFHNLRRFLGEVVPHPLQGEPWDSGTAWNWAAGILDEGGGFDAAIATLSISIVAIVLAMSIAFVFTLPAARNFANPEPFLAGPRSPSPGQRFAWGALVALARTILILLRSIPEYVWAFLLVAILGLNAWPAILALALHNAGILGRLTSEVVENVERPVPAALRGLGASREQITIFSLLPQNFGRLLLYFFYRWETCIREATVLGMLGIASLGFLIDDAKVALEYDEMFFLILVGAAIVVVVDFISLFARQIARRA